MIKMIKIKHRLKSWPHMFEAFIAGERLHDVRRVDERDFTVGDVVCLEEFIPESATYSGRRAVAEITYITSSMLPCPFFSEAIGEGFCILSLRTLPDPGSVASLTDRDPR